MTEGVIWKQLVLFAIPLIMGNVFQQLYNTVDSIVVGNYLGTSALAAVGATTAICNTLVNFFNGISIGAGVVISTSFGAKNHEKLHEAVETTILFAVIVGCFVSLISIGVVPVMLKWMSTPDDVVGPAGEYLKIYFAGVPVLFLYNMGSAILRAVGDTRRPLLFLIISSCLNIVLDILFVAVFHWGISGVAIATVMAETVSAFLACMTLTRTDGAHKLVLRDLHINKTCLGEIFRIGLPAGVQQGLTAFSNALVQAYCQRSWFLGDHGGLELPLEDRPVRDPAGPEHGSGGNHLRGTEPWREERKACQKRRPTGGVHGCRRADLHLHRHGTFRAISGIPF